MSIRETGQFNCHIGEKKCHFPVIASRLSRKVFRCAWGFLSVIAMISMCRKHFSTLLHLPSHPTATGGGWWTWVWVIGVLTRVDSSRSSWSTSHHQLQWDERCRSVEKCFWHIKIIAITLRNPHAQRNTLRESLDAITGNCHFFSHEMGYLLHTN